MARRTAIYDYDSPIVPRKCDASGRPKNIYPSAADAQQAALMAHYDYGAEVEAYQDPVCGHWHLTSKGQG